jgi:GTPase SAR1 family protein
MQTIRIGLVSERGAQVGATTLCMRFIDPNRPMSRDYIPTGDSTERRRATLMAEKSSVSIDLLDSAARLPVDVTLLCFSMADRRSFEYALEKRHRPDDKPCILVANKRDLLQEAMHVHCDMVGWHHFLLAASPRAPPDHVVLRTGEEEVALRGGGGAGIEELGRSGASRSLSSMFRYSGGVGGRVGRQVFSYLSTDAWRGDRLRHSRGGPVTTDEAMAMAANVECSGYVECSALSGEEVTAVFEAAMRAVGVECASGS